MTKPRIPQPLRGKLAEALATLDKGPAMETERALYGESAEHMAGMREAKQRYAQWVDHNVAGQLRQLLAWADGAVSVHEIVTYDDGMDYKPGRSKAVQP